MKTNRSVNIFVVCISLFLLATLVACAQEKADAGFTIVQDTLGASKIMLAVPKTWNKQVLMLAHGLRMEDTPVTAEFTPTGDCYGTLLAEGWLIANTSYRRNGYLHDEAIEDLDLLRKYVVEKYGMPERVYLLGASMGGAIVTRMAETRKGQYDGVLAIGAALNIGGINYAFAPQMPVLFLSNQNEMNDPRQYQQRAAVTPLIPAVWQVKRDGHCNTNDREELLALRALFAWREKGAIDDEKDATIVLTPASVARFHDGGASAAVANADINTRFVAADLEKLGITHGKTFALTFKEKTVNVLLGSSYFDVPRGQWVAFVMADGYVKIARNYASVREMLGCKEGDEIFIQPLLPAQK